MNTLVDQYQRSLGDLRISVTDKCNFRCSYCMPKTVFGRDYHFLAREKILSFEEIIRFAKLSSTLGVKKIRLTGGEPLLRHDLVKLVEGLSQIKDLELTLTTNGSLLSLHAGELKAAGLHRVTISLDALDPDLFKTISCSNLDPVKILQGIDAAIAVGFAPIKVNMVVIQGKNDHEIIHMARQFRGSGVILRFIEFMDVGNSNNWQLQHVLPAWQIIEKIHSVWPLQAIPPALRSDVAERWSYLDGAGEIGIISSVSKAFCSWCTRLRLSTDGKLYTCLFATQGHDLRKLLRSQADDDQLLDFLRQIWQQRGDRYSELRQQQVHNHGKKIEMSYIGG